MGFNWKTDGDFVEHDGNKDASTGYTEDFKISKETADWDNLGERGGDLVSYFRTGVTISNGGHVGQPEYFANLDVDTGTEVVDSFADTECDSCVWQVNVFNATNARTMTVLATWDAGTDSISSIQTRVTSTPGFPATLTISVDINSNNVRLLAVATADDWQVTARRLQIGQNVLSTSRRRGFITTDLTLYVATTGSDTTGTGESGTEWATPNKAMEWLRGKWIHPDATVTILCAEGTYTFTAALVLNHPCGVNIELIGATPDIVVWEGIKSTSGSEPYKTLELYVSDASVMSAGKYYGIRLKTRNVTRAEYACGMQYCSALDTGSDPDTASFITVHNDAITTGTGVADCGDIVIYKTFFDFTGYDGIKVSNGHTFGLINNIGVLGDVSGRGIVAQWKSQLVLGSSVGIAGFNPNLVATDSSYIYASQVTITTGETYNLWSSTNSHVNAPNVCAGGSGAGVCALHGGSVYARSTGSTYKAVTTGADFYCTYAVYNSHIDCESAYVTGSSIYGCYALYRSYTDAAYSFIENNQTTGLRAISFSYSVGVGVTFTGNLDDENPNGGALGLEESYTR